ncbi:helix-turn-helix domain-containing protein [Salmonella enterica]|nr:helix-turn-helix domain-containing protein [Salmonella enterica]
MQIGYVRVSTNDQNTDLQRNALNCAGCELIFEDKISGTKSERPGLKKLLRTLSEGDTLVVWKLDRLGRSMRHLVVLIEELRERGVNFRSLTDSIDTSTPMGRFFFHVMGALAEMERELIVERTRAGLVAARAQGRIGGRRPKLTPEQWAQAGRLIRAGLPRQQIAIIYDVGLSTLYKKFPVGKSVGLRETINRAAGAMQKDQNGGDIPDKDLFVRRIGATRAFDGAVNIGGDDNPWTTAEFISWLESCGAFNHPYWMCRGSWSYAHNKIITDTGCGNICLAGAVIEVMGVRGAMTIRVTTPTTTSGGGVASAQFTYINNGDGYSPGWRRDFNTVNKPAADEMGALSVNGGRINGALGIGTDNALGGNSIVLGDNDTGLKQNSDGVLDVYANNALVARLQPGKLYVVGDVLAGDGRKLSLTSDNNSSLNARFNLWGDANRPTVIELDDDQGWQYYSQRNPDGSIRFMVNGEIFTTSSIHAGANTISTDGNIYGSLWGGWLNDWINNTIINRFVQDIRLGGIEYAQAWNGPGYNDTPGYVITGVTNGNSDELIDGVHRRPLQKLIGGVWYNVASI